MSIIKSDNVEEELNDLKNIDENIKTEVKQIALKQILIIITINKSLITQNIIKIEDNIKFILLIRNGYPTTSPRLYCITRFCFPDLCDFRDLLENVIGQKWCDNDNDNHLKIENIINKIPLFVNDYLSKIPDLEYNKKIGKYYLDSIYEIEILKYIPYFFCNYILEITYSNDQGDIEGEERKLMLTDKFFLLFNENNSLIKKEMRLIFIGSITSFTYIKELTLDKTVEINWRIKGNNIYKMKFRTMENKFIVDTLINNLSRIKLKFRVTQTSLAPKKGEIPKVEIDLIEQEIKRMENQIEAKENINKESISVLMNLYERAVQYYSAINDSKFEIYIKKIQTIFSNEQYTKILNSKTFKNFFQIESKNDDENNNRNRNDFINNGGDKNNINFEDEKEGKKSKRLLVKISEEEFDDNQKGSNDNIMNKSNDYILDPEEEEEEEEGEEDIKKEGGDNENEDEEIHERIIINEEEKQKNEDEKNN